MPVYNGEKYLKTSIDSILNQTYSNFSFVIIDDGSTDSSREIINSYKDKRITLYINEKNRGLVFSLNRGLDECKDKYIVRMDSDDYSLPNRIEKQVEFMESHPNVGVCGSWYSVFSEDFKKKIKTTELPTSSEEIKSELFYWCCLCHPSTIIRVPYLNENNLRYSITDKHAEDYGLWVKCSHLFKLANIPEVLLHYRSTPTGICHTYPFEQKKATCRILVKNLENIGIYNTEKEMLELHFRISYRNRRIISGAEKKKVRSWYYALIEANKKTGYYSEPYFSNMVKMRIAKICDGFS